MYEPKRQFTYTFTTDEDQVLLDMIQFFDDMGLPDSFDSKAYESLSDKFFKNVQEDFMSKEMLFLIDVYTDWCKSQKLPR